MLNSGPPKIAVLSAIFNESLFIEECIASLKAQTLSDFEVIFVDDKSTDDTLTKVRKLIANDTRFSIYPNPSKGKVSAFNLAYRHSTASYVVLVAGDDSLPVDSLERRYTAVKCDTPDRQKIIAKGHVKTMSEDPTMDAVTLPKYPEGYFSGGAVTFTRALAKEIFRAPESLPNEDSWLRLCAEYLADKVLPSPGISLNYRIHERNSSGARVGFEKAHKAFVSRSAVYQLFLDHYRNHLEEHAIRSLSARAKLCDSVKRGKSWSILLLREAPLRDRLRGLVHSSRFVYWLKLRLWRYVTGRI